MIPYMPMVETNLIQTDVVIMGGGIAGLWALNRLKALGYSAVLVESNSLGGGQTVKSQGIIHGGLKYTLKGFMTPSADSIENMPNRWKACLQGKGEIDLSATAILSNHQLMFSTGRLASDITNFFASRALKSRVKILKKTEYPTLLQDPSFKGQVYELDEIVLDVPSLIKTLATPHYDFIIKVNIQNEMAPNEIEFLTLKSNHSTVNLKAKCYLFAAGEGNEALCAPFSSLLKPPRMQRRPLQMVMIKLPKAYPLYGHCIDAGATPKMTITTHYTQTGESVWYLGGQVAEEGINRTPAEQISASKKELNTLFPWLNLSDAKFATFFINRAEPAQPNGKRPDTFYIQSVQNTVVAWPTKLALTPVLIDHFISHLERHSILPSHPSDSAEKKLANDLSVLEKPGIALGMWDTLSFIGTHEMIEKNRQKFLQIKALNLPEGQYAITGSGALGIRNLREINDIDLIVDSALWNTLAAQYGVIEEKGIRRIVFSDGLVEALGEDSFSSEPKEDDAPTIAERLAAVDIIEGLPFESLQHVAYYKKKMGREKDLKDLLLIETYKTDFAK